MANYGIINEQGLADGQLGVKKVPDQQFRRIGKVITNEDFKKANIEETPIPEEKQEEEEG